MTAQHNTARAVPKVHNVVLDTTDVRRAAEFYRGLLDWHYREGDAPPADGQADPPDTDWLVLRHPGGGVGLAFQLVADLPRVTWPEGAVPQQLHLDLTAPDFAALVEFRRRAEDLGATVILDRSDDPEDQLYVLTDPDGHPFCIFVG